MLKGGKGDDELYGGKGRDTLMGGEGDDTLTLIPRKDEATGGRGADTFVFSVDSVIGIPTITDFDPSEDAFVIEGAGLGLVDQTIVTFDAFKAAHVLDPAPGDTDLFLTFDDASGVAFEGGLTAEDLRGRITLVYLDGAEIFL